MLSSPEVSRVRCASCNERPPHLDDIILRQLGHLLHARGPHGDEVDQADGRLNPTRRHSTTQNTTSKSRSSSAPKERETKTKGGRRAGRAGGRGGEGQRPTLLVDCGNHQQQVQVVCTQNGDAAQKGAIVLSLLTNKTMLQQ